MAAFYTYGEDLCAGMTGPFSTREEAQAHVAFCTTRGDADPGTVITGAEADAKQVADPGMLVLTPEADRAFVV